MGKVRRRNVCFVTGTRAEYGLMVRTLDAIASHPSLRLQVIATGMHLDVARGSSVDQIRHPRIGGAVIVPWSPAADAVGTAVATGQALANLAEAYRQLKTEIVLVVGDRVEALAAAAAANVSGVCVAHVHGGDRALGLVDDSLRHAVSKLAHLHFPATATSAQRLIRLGEDRWRVHRVGSPGLDGIRQDAAPKATVRSFVGQAGPFLLVSLHPACDDVRVEADRAHAVLQAARSSTAGTVVVVFPNNDPGSDGIIRTYREFQSASRAGQQPAVQFHQNLSRDLWLGLLRDSAALVGNSSSGIIEAASFGTPVVDIGPRQQGRERGANVIHCAYDRAAIQKAIRKIVGTAQPIRFARKNLYGDGNTAARIANRLAAVTLDERLLQKLIAY